MEFGDHDLEQTFEDDGAHEGLISDNLSRLGAVVVGFLGVMCFAGFAFGVVDWVILPVGAILMIVGTIAWRRSLIVTEDDAIALEDDEP